MKKLLLIFFSIIFSLQLFSQQIPLDMQVQNRFNEITLNADTSIFTGFRSINWLELQPYSIIREKDITDSIFSLSSADNKSYFLKNIDNDNWIKIAGNKSVITIDPYITATAGIENNHTGSTFQAVGGIHLQGVYNNKLSYSFNFSGGYEQFPSYINNFIDSNQHYIPGIGKGSLQSNGGYNLSQITANITYLAGKHIVIAAGYGKNFIGDGYRSLILSDNSANYPYIRIQAKLWKLTYNVLYNYFSDPRYTIDGSTQMKYSVMHYLGINFSKKFQLGLYDNIIWLAKDSNSQRGFDVQYLNPLIFMRPLEFAIGSPDNAFLGFTFKYKIYKKGFLYGQLGLDDLNLTTSLKNHAQSEGNKYALQLGIWNNNFLHIKNLSYRFEWNGVRPYTYGHGFDKTALNYTNANQTLADPFNANFHEFISIFDYHKQRWYGTLENLFAIRGENPGLPYNNGEDLWGGENGVPQFGSKTLQGIRNNFFYNQFTAGYLLNPKNGLALQTDIIYRMQTSTIISSHDLFFTIGIQTKLFNYYHDF